MCKLEKRIYVAEMLNHLDRRNDIKCPLAQCARAVNDVFADHSNVTTIQGGGFLVDPTQRRKAFSGQAVKPGPGPATNIQDSGASRLLIKYRRQVRMKSGNGPLNKHVLSPIS